MARANLQSSQNQSGPAPDPHEWQALRSELVALLEQVEGRYIRAPKPEAGLQGIADRMRDLREQVAGVEPESRRREALRSVKRAVDRFTEREEPEPAANPRDALEAAISEIRTRQAKEAEQPMPRPQAANQAVRPEPLQSEAPRTDLTPRFEELARSVGGISNRLERLEVELKAQHHNQADIREIADQVSQVSHVVELLAGAVGETGHVKRLEGQIAGLAKLITEGQRVDMTTLTQRLDDVSATVERLADLQIQHVSREKDVPALARRLDDVSATIERLADLQVQHVAREKDLPSIGAKLGEVSKSVEKLAGLQAESVARDSEIPALGARLGEVSRSVDRLVGLQAESVSREREIIPAFGSRLGEVSASVERLVDLQTMHVRAIKDVPAQQEALRAGMQAIEKGVRTVYDRIDVIEKNYALCPADFEKLTEEMARFTAAMQEASQPQGLLQLVDALNARIAEIETRDSEVGGLKDDIQALRGAVIEAVEPRMAAIETRIEALSEHGAAISEVAPRIAAIQTQLEALSERGAALYDVGPRIEGIETQLEALNERGSNVEDVGPRMAVIQSQLEMLSERGAAIEDVGPQMALIHSQLEALNERVAERSPEPSVGQIEAQVRQLVARMDQTGEQLTGLARMYSEAEEREQSPDYEALAELVAARTSEAVARAETFAPAGITAQDISELEARMSRLFKAVATEAPVPDFSDVTEGIRRVDERLERLELALGRLAEEGAAPAVPFTPAFEAPGEQQVFSAAMPPRRGDSMPVSPAEDRPLTDRPFPDHGPVRVLLETRIGGRKRHPGLDDEPLDFSEMAPLTPQMMGGGEQLPAQAPRESTAPPSLDPATVPRPPRPESSLATSDREVFSSGVAPLPEPASQTDAEAPQSTSRSTFIEAARRAAQRQMESKPEAASNSLIARALARFQLGADKKPALEKPLADVKPTTTAKPVKAKPQKLEPSAEASEPAVEALVRVPPAPKPRPEMTGGGKDSFLTRHRQPILLAASIVALSFLTLNLINQRMAGQLPAPAAVETDAPAEPAASSGMVSALPVQVAPQAPEAAAQVGDSGPRVIPMVDSLSTGSIDPAAAATFTPPAAMPAMPQAFKAVAPAEVTAVPDAIASPIKVELAPESIGPLELRQAAAGGDARAQFEIGAIYTEGRAVPQDLQLAATWYERAAAQGFAPAQYRLGNLYENGQGVTKDLEQARLWYQRAAEAGNRMSMHNLAALYAGGNLGKQEFDSAAQWFEKAANQGLTDSQFNLGMLYARGLGVPQSMETSYKWFALAARNGDKDAATARDDVAKSLDAEAVSRLAAEIAAWKPTAIDLAANFAPIGTWSANFDPGEVIETRDVVLGVQTLLTRLGYDVGTPDGLAGPKTAEAIRAFEKATGMSESGTINPRLLAVLASQPV